MGYVKHNHVLYVSGLVFRFSGKPGADRLRLCMTSYNWVHNKMGDSDSKEVEKVFNLLGDSEHELFSNSKFT